MDVFFCGHPCHPWSSLPSQVIRKLICDSGTALSFPQGSRYSCVNMTSICSGSVPQGVSTHDILVIEMSCKSLMDVFQVSLKSTRRDRSWTGDYAMCGRCHLAYAAWFTHVPYLLQSNDLREYPVRTSLVSPLHMGIFSFHARGTLIEKCSSLHKMREGLLF